MQLNFFWLACFVFKMDQSKVFVFPVLSSQEKAFLEAEVPWYVQGILSWNYRPCLEAIYIRFLKKFPEHRHEKADDSVCRSQHITILSREMHRIAMLGAFRQIPGLYDLMKLVNPIYLDEALTVPDEAETSAMQLPDRAHL
ncbi:hypothetical protein C8J56DRAFT_1050079 [Mycena floridula]|nr:hypothetical protein C8J56DRAFT_1050079 [Mycena floridula]